MFGNWGLAWFPCFEFFVVSISITLNFNLPLVCIRWLILLFIRNQSGSRTLTLWWKWVSVWGFFTWAAFRFISNSTGGIWVFWGSLSHMLALMERMSLWCFPFFFIWTISLRNLERGPFTFCTAIFFWKRFRVSCLWFGQSVNWLFDLTAALRDIFKSRRSKLVPLCYISKWKGEKDIKKGIYQAMKQLQ